MSSADGSLPRIRAPYGACQRQAGVGPEALNRISIAILLLPLLAAAAEPAFTGLPVRKVQVTDGKAVTSELSPAQAAKFRVEIVREGDGYVWASRGNVPMVRVDSGAYTTYLAATGAGYVRVMDRDIAAALAGPGKEWSGFLYMEHLVDQMGSITYFGR